MFGAFRLGIISRWVLAMMAVLYLVFAGLLILLHLG
jgi:hypothetical protein